MKLITMKNYVPLFLLAVLAACSPETKQTAAPATVEETTIGQHIGQLASDEFLGRMPFTEGETKTVNYLKDEFAKLGLQPGNGDSYFQEVPMVEITGTPSETMTLAGPGKTMELGYLKDFVALTLKPTSEVSLENSELVFAGYGIVAPEYGWNDYEGIDWAGKTAVVLVNDPG
ncbi:MAG: peptidase M28, partial [Imperialibacter sp.]